VAWGSVVSFSSGVWGEAPVSSPSRVWDRAPAEIKFSALNKPYNMTSGGNNFNYFPQNQLTKFSAFSVNNKGKQ